LYFHLWRQPSDYPWSQNKDGRGPAWSNSLFEDNAEFGLGMRLTIDKQTEYAHELLKKLAGTIGESLVDGILNADQTTDAGIKAQRERVEELKKKLNGNKDVLAQHLLSIADVLVKKSVWIMGGDGWAYDIGYGGLDHVLASGRNVNVLVLDTEVYSNTVDRHPKLPRVPPWPNLPPPVKVCPRKTSV
jgi:pyruvate-ferredoxin/flavodoxin oxidoreductase